MSSCHQHSSPTMLAGHSRVACLRLDRFCAAHSGRCGCLMRLSLHHEERRRSSSRCLSSHRCKSTWRDDYDSHKSLWSHDVWRSFCVGCLAVIALNCMSPAQKRCSHDGSLHVCARVCACETTLIEDRCARNRTTNQISDDDARKCRWQRSQLASSLHSCTHSHTLNWTPLCALPTSASPSASALPLALVWSRANWRHEHRCARAVVLVTMIIQLSCAFDAATDSAAAGAAATALALVTTLVHALAVVQLQTTTIRI